MKMPAFVLRLLKNGQWIAQFVRFGIVGLSNTLIALGVYWLCYYAFHFHYQWANFIGFVVSVTNAYFWNNRFVFQSGAKSLKAHIIAYFKAFFAYGLTYALGVILLYVWIERFGIGEGIAPLINLVITVPINFVLNKYWAFRRSGGEKA